MRINEYTNMKTDPDLKAAIEACNFDLKIGNEYRGKWVVIIAGKLFGAGPDVGPILEKANKAHPDKIPFAYQVPANDSMIL